MITLAALVLFAPCAGYQTILDSLDKSLRVDLSPDGVSKLLEKIAVSSNAEEKVTDKMEAAEVAEPTSDEAKLLEGMRYSSIRLQSTVSERNMMRPWETSGPEATFVGSGFVVRNSPEHGPLIVTNNHVVADTGNLIIQVPAAGQQTYDARVVLTNPDMDIALVEFKDAAEVAKMEKDVGHELPAVKLFKGNAKLGMEVVAMGFPLGQSTVKITKGVLSGHEKVGEFLSYQQTAPISPGNSGGPLFISGTKQVLGINFAAAVGESSQNNNYAIPSWHVQQMLHEFDATAEPPAEDADLPSQTYNQATCRADHTNCIYHVPKMKAMAMAGNEELYGRYGCPTGIFVNKIEKGSIALSADPPIREKSFITAVNGMTIDKFGMVKSDKYFGDPIIFTDIGVMSPTFKSVDVTVCTCGKTEDHRVSTSALHQRRIPELEEESSTVPHIEEPSTAKMDFEEFGGVTVQPLTVNIIKSLAEGHGRMDLIRFAVKKQKKPLLVVTGVSKIKERTGSLQVGDIVASINGHKVSTLSEFRAHFEPTGSNGEWEGEDQCKSGAHMWTLETTTGRELAEDWHEALKYQREAITRGDKPLSLAVKKALSKSHHGLPSLMQNEKAPLATAAPVTLPIEQRTNVRRGGAPGFDVASFIKGIM